MKKLLIICGPTATGKTRLAHELAQKFSGELVSADSRHLIKGFTILTGKDIPSHFSYHPSVLLIDGRPLGYFGNGTKIWLTDVVGEGEEISVSFYRSLAQRVIGDIWERGLLPIAIGGTGFYIKALVDSYDTLSLPPNNNLRQKLGQKTIMELQKLLTKEDQVRARSMNHSDWNNPRRLIRAIEVAQIKSLSMKGMIIEEMDCLWIGLTAPFSILEQNIKERIEERIKSGVIDEVRKEIIYGEKRHFLQTILGFDAIFSHLQGKISKEEAIVLWFQKERQYAKRQLTWFSKEKRIRWFDISSEFWKEDVTAYVSQWYTKKERYADKG